jgi:hypothetical protein
VAGGSAILPPAHFTAGSQRAGFLFLAAAALGWFAILYLLMPETHKPRLEDA